MEIDQECTVDTMESNITTGLTITRWQAHSFGSSTYLVNIIRISGNELLAEMICYVESRHISLFQVLK